MTFLENERRTIEIAHGLSHDNPLINELLEIINRLAYPRCGVSQENHNVGYQCEYPAGHSGAHSFDWRLKP
jgi:hypothetical protein